MIGGLVGQFLNVTILGMAARQSLWPLLCARPRFSNIKRAMKRYRVYPIYTLPYSLSVAFTERALQVAIASMYSLTFLSTYYVARQILLAPAQIVSAAMRNVLLSHGARHDSIEETRPYVANLVGLFSAACAPLLATGAIWLKPIILVMLGDRWPNMADLAWWCMWPGATLMLTGSIDRLFDLAGRQRTAVLLQLCSDSATLGIIVLVWYFKWTGLTMVTLISCGLAAYNMIWFIIILRIVSFSFQKIGEFFLRFFAPFSIFLVIQYAMSMLQQNSVTPWIGLLLGLCASAFAIVQQLRSKSFDLSLDADRAAPAAGKIV
jgi:O-antigen/teichoic acid export membrane protein